MNNEKQEAPKYSDPSGAPRIIVGIPIYEVGLEHTIVQRLLGGAGGPIVNTLTTLYSKTVVPGTAEQALSVVCQLRMDANMAMLLGACLIRSAFLNVQIGDDLYVAMKERISELARALQAEQDAKLDEARQKDRDLAGGYTAPLEDAPSC